MKRKTTILLGLVLLVGVVVWLSQREPETAGPQPGVLPEAAVTPGDRQRENAAQQKDGNQSEQVRAARQRVADAKLALQSAVDARESAEAEMQKAEVEIDELERWVAEIEERGEDPVDYADEGLARLQPAFFAYQDAFDRFELAETMEVEALEELTAANAELSELLAANETEK